MALTAEEIHTRGFEPKQIEATVERIALIDRILDALDPGDGRNPR